MPSPKPEVISFKADPSLSKAMDGIPNRSEFIRNAILAALDGVCPLCQGTGILSPQQKTHWQTFAQHHQVRRCQSCDAVHLVCAGPAGAAKGGEVHE